MDKDQRARERAAFRALLDHETVLDCIADGTHLTDCDDDGYCNFCGHQDQA